MKNQWCWGGFTTKDPLRCQVAARNVALLLCAVGRMIESGRQVALRLTSAHAEAARAQRLLTGVSLFLSGLLNTAEQLTEPAVGTDLESDSESVAACGGPAPQPQLMKTTLPGRSHHHPPVRPVIFHHRNGGASSSTAIFGITAMVERGIRLSPTSSQLIRSAGRMRIAGAIFNLVIGVVFVARGPSLDSKMIEVVS